MVDIKFKLSQRNFEDEKSYRLPSRNLGGPLLKFEWVKIKDLIPTEIMDVDKLRWRDDLYADDRFIRPLNISVYPQDSKNYYLVAPGDHQIAMMAYLGGAKKILCFLEQETEKFPKVDWAEELKNKGISGIKDLVGKLRLH